MTNNTNATTEWVIQWLRNNYQDHPNIAGLCDALREAAPPAPEAGVRRPLTDEQVFSDVDIMAANARIGARMSDIMRIVRAIESAHGIGGPAQVEQPERKGVEWQPIETGPVNVEVLALYKGARHVIAMQRSADDSPSGWCHQEAFGNDGPFRGLTHWAPLLPAPPAGTNTTEGA